LLNIIHGEDDPDADEVKHSFLDSTYLSRIPFELLVISLSLKSKG